MKTRFFLMIGLLVFAGIVWSQNENRQSKASIKEAKVKKEVESGRFRMVMNQVHLMRGNMISLTSEYTLALTKDSAISYLPYFGRAYSAPMSSEGGIKFSESVQNKKMSFDAKKGSYTYSFTARAKDDTYQFFIMIWLNGSVTVNVICNNKQPIDYTGEVILPEL